MVQDFLDDTSHVLRLHGGTASRASHEAPGSQPLGSSLLVQTVTVKMRMTRLPRGPGMRSSI